MEMGLNNLHWLICHKTKPNQTKHNLGRIELIYNGRLISLVSPREVPRFKYFKIYIYNKYRKQHPTKQLRHSHKVTISQTIQIK